MYMHMFCAGAPCHGIRTTVMTNPHAVPFIPRRRRLAAFFEKAMDPKSGLACSSRLCRNSDNGRYGVIFGQIFHAHNAITLCYQYLQSQLPYGYIHLILLTVQLTSELAASSTLYVASTHDASTQLWARFPGYPGEVAHARPPALLAVTLAMPLAQPRKWQ
jgi:hypothetical protein